MKFQDYPCPKINHISLYKSNFLQDLLNFYCFSSGISMKELLYRINKNLEKKAIVLTLGDVRSKLK